MNVKSYHGVHVGLTEQFRETKCFFNDILLLHITVYHVKLFSSAVDVEWSITEAEHLVKMAAVATAL